jgi:hypothetical protein
LGINTGEIRHGGALADFVDDVDGTAAGSLLLRTVEVVVGLEPCLDGSLDVAAEAWCQLLERALPNREWSAPSVIAVVTGRRVLEATKHRKHLFVAPPVHTVRCPFREIARARPDSHGGAGRAPAYDEDVGMLR